MCDCFHLAFPNWHAPAPGHERRLRGPEQDTEDDSVCEEPELLEAERPRPQGSSPVDEFPADKKAEEIYNSPHKRGSSKKVRKASQLDKITSAKMKETEEIQTGEPGVIVKTVKEVCAEGLVVTGGGKEGIFIKEVKPDSPASKLLSFKEGDQILSATIYFDNVSYEDALQIFEHSQPYKLEFCLRRKMESITPEYAEIKYPEGKEGDSPKTRRQINIKKQQDRISWPKFPSFGKGPRAQFKRSHSTSEAEEHRKLEMSPPTSDTESPFKSPLKSPDGKQKKKKHKVQLRMKMKSHRSKSVEEAQVNGKDLTSGYFVVLENQEGEDVLEENINGEFIKKTEEILQVLEKDSSNIGNGMELQHTVHLISLGNTLKTTDIQIDPSEGGKVECSEMKFRIQREISEIESSPCDNAVKSQAMVEQSLLDTDIKTQRKRQDNSESRNVEMIIPNLDNTFSGEGDLSKSPRTVRETQCTERTILENESYGIRTRGPLAEMATSKTHFVSNLNGLQFMSPDYSMMTQEGNMPEDINVTNKQSCTNAVISQPKYDLASTVCALGMEDSHTEITSKLQTKTTTDDILADRDTKSESKIKLPMVDPSGFVISEPIIIKEVKTKTLLPKREDIEIPGMEDKETKHSQRTPEMKIPKTEKIINITKERKIQTPEEFNVEDVKEAVSKFPAFKLPEGDITGVLVQREIAIMEKKSERSGLTPMGSPNKISIPSTESSTKMPESNVPKAELPYTDEQTSLTVTRIHYTKSEGKSQQAKPDTILITDDGKFRDVKFILPKREDIEIPGMEAIRELNVPTTRITAIRDKDPHQVPELPHRMSNSPVVEQETAKTMMKSDIEISKRSKTKKHGDMKGQEKKSKRSKVTMSNTGITKHDITLSDNIELPKKDVTSQNLATFKIPTIGENSEDENADIVVPEIRILKDKNGHNLPLPEGSTEEANTDRVGDTAKEYETKFKIPSITLPQFGAKPSKGTTEASAIDVQSNKAEINLMNEEIKLAVEQPLSDTPGPDMIKDGSSFSMRTKETGLEDQGRKFKLPKFEFNFPEIKAPKITLSASKKEGDSTIPEKMRETPVVHQPYAELTDVKPEVNVEMPGSDSKHLEVKLKRPDMTVPERSAELEEATITMLVEGSGQKDRKKYGSPTKYKLPSITFPKFGAKVAKEAIKGPDVELDAKGPEMNLPDAELKLSVEPLSVDIKLPDVDQETKSVNVEVKDHDIQTEAKERIFKLPKFEISFPEVKAPKTDLTSKMGDSDISVPKGRVQVHPPEEKADQQEQRKQRKLESSFPKVETKTPGVDVYLRNVDVSVPEGCVQMEGQSKDTELSVEDSGQKLPTKFSSPTKFKLPSFTLPKFGAKQAKVEISTVDTDVELEVGTPDVYLQDSTTEVNADLPEKDSKSREVKKTPGFSIPKIGFSRSETETSETKVNLPNVDLSLSKRSVEMERLDIDSALSMEDSGQKEDAKVGSSKKFKLPSVCLPKMEAEVPKVTVEISDVNTDVQKLEVNILDAELKYSAEPLSVDIMQPDVDKEAKSLVVEMTDQDIEIEGKDSRFRLPKSVICLPEIKGPRIDLHSTKAESNISASRGEPETHTLDVIVQDITTEVKTDRPDKDFKGLEVKIKKPVISFPRIGFSKSELKTTEAEVNLSNVDVSLAEGTVEMEGPRDSKFKFPTMTLPNVGALKHPKTAADVSAMDTDVKEPEMPQPPAELTLSSEPLSLDIQGPEGPDRKVKFPKFGMSHPEVKEPKTDLKAKKVTDISVPKGELKMQTPDIGIQDRTAEVGVDLPEVDSKGIETKTKQLGFSLPRIGFGKSESMTTETEVNLPNVDVSLPESSTEIEGLDTDITMSKQESKQKESSKFGSPTKFKLPSISLPKFGAKVTKATVDISSVDIDAKGPEIDVPDVELNVSDKPSSVNIKGPDVDKDAKSLSVEIKNQDIKTDGQDSKIKFPKFGISLPDVKGPKIDLDSKKADIDISVQRGVVETHKSDVEVQDVTAEVNISLPEKDSKGLEVKMKRPGFSLPRIGFSKSGHTAPEAEVNSTNVDVSLPDGRVDMEGRNTDITLSMEDPGLKEQAKFGYSMKVEYPSVSLPKMKAKVPETAVEFSDVNVDVKGPEITLPGAELKLSTEPLAADSVPDEDKEVKSLNVEMKDQDITIKGKDSKFKLPTFGISLPEIKGPKIDSSSKKADIDISAPKGKEVHIPVVEVKPDIPESDSKDLELKMKGQGISFPKFGFAKSETKASTGDVNLPTVDMSLPEGSIEMEGMDTDITISKEESKQKESSKFGSPTKFKLPSISLPKFGAKVPKATVDISSVDIDVKRPEMDVPDVDKDPKADGSHPDYDMSLPERSMEIEGQDTDVTLSKEEIKEKDSKFGSPIKFKLPSISLPKFGTKVPKATVDISSVDIDAKGPEIDVPDVELSVSDKPSSVNIKGTDVDKEATSLSVEIKNQDIKRDGQDSKFKFPKFGISLPDVKGPKLDLGSKKADIDISVQRGVVETHKSDVEVQDVTAEVNINLPEKDSKGLEMKMKRPGFSLPRIGFSKSGHTAPEAEVNLTNVDVSLPDGRVDMEGRNTDITLSMEDPGLKEQAKFGYSMKVEYPSVSLPKLKAKVPETAVEFSDVNVDVKGPEITLPGAELKLSTEPLAVDSVPDEDKEMKSLNMEMKDQDITIKSKDSKFKLPTFGISLPEIKGPKIDSSSKKADIDISAPKGKDVHIPVVEVKPDIPESDSKDLELKMKGQGISFPKFGFAKSETKASTGDVNLPTVDMSLPEGSIEMEGMDTDITISKEESKQKESSKFGSPTKFKLPSISLPKFGAKVPKATVDISSVDIDAKGPEIDVPDVDQDPKADGSHPDYDLSLPGRSMEIEGQDTDVTLSKEEIKEKDSKFGSPIKFKLPSISLPKFGTKVPKATVDISSVDIDAKGPETDVPDVELNVSDKPSSVNIKGTDVDKEAKSLSVEIKNQDIKTDGQDSKFKFPKFGISLPDVKGPKLDLGSKKADIDISVQRGVVETHKSDVEVQDVTAEVNVSLPEKDPKGLEVKMKRPGFSLPRIGFSKSGHTAPEAEVNLTNVDVSLPDGRVDMEGRNTDITLSMEDPGLKEQAKFGYSMKVEYPSVSLPKLKAKVPETAVEFSDVNVDVKGPEITLPGAELKLSTEPLAADSVPDEDKEVKSLNVEMKDQDITIKGKDSKFKLPTFGISLPEIKGPKIDSSSKKADIDISAPKGKDVHIPVVEVKPDIPESDSKDLELKMKGQGISFPKFGFAKSETKASTGDVNLPTVDVSLPEGSIEMEGMDTDITISKEESKQKESSRFGSPTKFKLPSISLPKFGAKVPKATVDISSVDIDVKRPEMDVPDVDQDAKADVSHPDYDLSLPERSTEIEGQDTDVALSKEEIKEKDSKFGSPIKFKLPSISLPKFGTKVPKATLDISSEDVDAKGPEMDVPDVELNVSDKPSSVIFGAKVPKATAEITIVDRAVKEAEVSIPDSELKLSAEPLSGGTAGTNLHKDGKQTGVELKDQDIQIKGQERKLKLPKFEITLPEVKTPKVDSGSNKEDIHISILKGNEDAHSHGVKLQDVTAELKADIPDIDSKGLEVKMKRPGFSFPKFGFSTSETKAPEVDASTPNVNDALGEGSVQLEETYKHSDLTDKDADQKETTKDVKKASTKFGSPTKFTLPSIKFPKFGAKATKETVDFSSVEADLKPTEISLPDSGVKLSAEPITVSIKGNDVDNEENSLFSLGQTVGIKLPNVDLQQAVHDCADIETEVDKHSSASKPKAMDSKITKSQDGDNVVTNVNVALQPKHKEQTHILKSPQKIMLPTLSKVLKTFDIEFNIPKLPADAEDIPGNGVKDEEVEKNSTQEVEEDSPTLSLRSSEAFADVSSGPTTEQIGLTEASLTKVKVKYSEPTVTSELTDIHDAITSTARTELISIKPHQPEKVNIPFSSETSSSSVHTLKKAPGEIHIVGPVEQTISSTQHAEFITVNTHNTQTLPPKRVADSLLSVEKTIVRKEQPFMEKQVRKEIFGDEKDTVVVTRSIQLFEGGLTEPVSDSTASSIQKLRDTVHVEKMRFFESIESTKKTTTSTETYLRHADSSADENEGRLEDKNEETPDS